MCPERGQAATGDGFFVLPPLGLTGEPGLQVSNKHWCMCSWGGGQVDKAPSWYLGTRKPVLGGSLF